MSFKKEAYVERAFLDSPETFRKEAAILFPKFDIDDWYEKEETEFRNGKVVFDEENFVHRVQFSTVLTNVRK